MKDHLPPSDSDPKHYERPNQKWVCGWLCDGTPCRNGPDGNGKCGATAACKPALASSDDPKNRTYVCTRSKENGGPCDEGPRPDGRCSHPPRYCQPQYSLRAKRGLLTKAVVAATIAILLVLLYGANRSRFISPGELSFKHQSLAFQQKAREIHNTDQSCATCHETAKVGPLTWLEAAINADPAPHEFQKLLLNPEPRMNRIDASCQKCHPLHDFHEPNVAWDYSCSACHQEHRGRGSIKQPAVSNCVRCHGDRDVMLAASMKAALLPVTEFNFQYDWSRNSFKPSRPTNGLTHIIHEFAEDHPDFQVHRENLTDANTLRFSHATHLSNSPKMTLRNGQRIDCAFCHKPGPGGVYYKSVTYENNCRICHALQFDKENPNLTVPHGNAGFVHSFVRSLPQQFADFARRDKHMTSEAEVKKFVLERVQAMRRTYGSGEQLEEAVFFSDEHKGPATNVGNLGDESRSLFPGCAYCHEVKRGGEVPIVTAPVMPERWLNRGRFDHSRHTSLTCTVCHQAGSSKQASDILLPTKAICASCHQPNGAARNDCYECHSYHHLRDAAVQQTALEKPVKRL